MAGMGCRPRSNKCNELLCGVMLLRYYRSVHVTSFNPESYEHHHHQHVRLWRQTNQLSAGPFQQENAAPSQCHHTYVLAFEMVSLGIAVLD